MLVSFLLFTLSFNNDCTLTQRTRFTDSIHAAKMQMNEVKSGWKHSTDPASKARVREALNAGLSAMPGK